MRLGRRRDVVDDIAQCLDFSLLPGVARSSRYALEWGRRTVAKPAPIHHQFRHRKAAINRLISF